MNKEFDIYKDREQIEWTNTWIEDCNNKNSNRVLFVGDSVLRNLRSAISERVVESIDFIGSSRSLEDPKFYKIFDAFFDDSTLKYSKIVVNLGTNHGHHFLTNLSELNKEKYTNAFENFVKFLMKIAPKIVILTGSPWVLKDDISKLDDDMNLEICTKNKIQMNVANKYNLKVVDLYSHIISNYPQYQYIDYVHFKPIEDVDITTRYIIKNAELTCTDEAKKYFEDNLAKLASGKTYQKHKVYKIFGISIKIRNKQAK